MDDNDVKCERVATPTLLRGDAKIIADVLAEKVVLLDSAFLSLEEKKRRERLRLLVTVFVALGGGKSDPAATVYGAMTEGY